MQAFVEELERVTGGEEFIIENDIVWTALLDSRDMLIVHLASWAKAMYNRGGFFGQLQAHYLNYIKRSPKDLTSEDMNLEQCAEAYDKLFPWKDGASHPTTKPYDIKALKQCFIAEFSSVTNDRDINRAHFFDEGDKVKAAMLDLKVLAEKFESAEEILNRLRLLCNLSRMANNDLNNASSEETAKELVAMVMVGGFNDQCMKYGILETLKTATDKYPWQVRDEYFKNLSEKAKRIMKEV